MIPALLQTSPGVLEHWPKIIAEASKSPLGIIALALLLITVLALSFFRKADRATKLAVFLVMFAGLAMYGFAITRAENEVYRVRVMVLDPEGAPAEDAHVWSSFGGEPMKVSGGWLFVIPSQTKPTGEMTVYAEVKDGFLKGKQTLVLADNKNPTATVQLVNLRNATLRGIVEDENRAAISGAEVSVVGYDSEKITTKSTGSFELRAHAATDQQVQVHAEKKGYRGVTAWCQAGESVCELNLRRERYQRGSSR